MTKEEKAMEVIIELCEYCGMDNLYPYDNLEEIETTFKDTFDNYQLQRITSLERLNNLEKENAKLKGQVEYLTEIGTEFQKILSIIKKKNVDIYELQECKSVEQYNKKCDCWGIQLTEEEFDLLKEVVR